MVANLETIDLGRLRLFSRVVERASFTEAARSLQLPKSSVSKGVRALENDLGIQLLQRTSRSVRATHAGDGLYEAVRPALAVIDESLAAASALGAAARGRVRISCPPDFDGLMAVYVTRFCQRHPGVQVEVSASSRKVDLIAEGYDLALRGGELRDSGLVTRASLHSSFGLFASPRYLQNKKVVRRVQDLDDHVCVGVPATGGHTVWNLASRNGRAVAKASCQVATDDMRLAIRLAEAGAGIVLLPLITAARPLAGSGLVRILPRFCVPDVKLRLLAPGGLEPMAVRLFREGLLRESWARKAAKRLRKGGAGGYAGAPGSAGNGGAGGD